MPEVLRIDANRCMGHGLCYRIAPEFLDGDDEGFVAQRGRDVPLRPEDMDAAMAAEAACPEQAIEVVDSQTSP